MNKSQSFALLVGILLILAGLFCAAARGQDSWTTSVETNFTGTTWTWWNDTDDMIKVDALYLRWAAAIANTVNVYRVDASTNLFEIEQASSNSIQYVLITPTGNGEIRIPDDNGVRVVQGATNAVNAILDRRKCK